MATHFSVTPWIREARKDLSNRAEEVSRTIGDASFKSYYVGATATPVCTGYLRASWQVNLNKPATRPFKKTGNCKGRRVDIHSAIYARNRAKAKSATKRFDILRHKTIFITNTAPYSGVILPRYGIDGKVWSSLKNAL